MGPSQRATGGSCAAASSTSRRCRARATWRRGSGPSVPRDTGFPPSPLPSWLHLRQYVKGHQQADRLDRPEGRHQGLPVHRWPLDARDPRARLRRAAQIDRMAQRARRGCRLFSAAWSQTSLRSRRLLSRTCWSTARSTPLLSPDLIRPLTAGDKRVGAAVSELQGGGDRLLSSKTGIFPIMHVVGIKQEIVERHPWVAHQSLHRRSSSPSRSPWSGMENPRIVPLAWYREGWEEQERILGKGPLGIWAGGAQRTRLRAARHLFARAGLEQAAAPAR